MQGEGTVKLRSGAVDWRMVQSEVVALHIERSEYMTVNASGSALWPLLVEGATITELRSRLAEAFAVTSVKAGEDVDAFLAELARLDLLERT